jgi:predicted MFS family arabinose efflux permease
LDLLSCEDTNAHFVLVKRTASFYILPIIVLAQFAGTALWFASNAVMGDLCQELGLQPEAVGHLTTAVQLGFIGGTLIFAAFSIPDRFPASRVFLVAAIVGGAANLSMLWAGNLGGLMLGRVVVGISLAGIYPVGMKIAADWYAKGLGKALGYLVGALVVGTAFPHLLKALSGDLSWQILIASVSGIAILGGCILWWWVPAGPYSRPPSAMRPGAVFQAFRTPSFRGAALGYFGHMWELYAFWAFVPLFLQAYGEDNPLPVSSSLAAFAIIGVGGVGCVLGGYWALRRGSSWIARWSMAVSGTCGVLAIWFFHWPFWMLFIALLIWGSTVVSDSPQLSTLVARTAPPELKGSSLTIVNSIGFAITIGSIQLLTALAGNINSAFLFLVLVPGPLLGWIALRRVRG